MCAGPVTRDREPGPTRWASDRDGRQRRCARSPPDRRCRMALVRSLVQLTSPGAHVPTIRTRGCGAVSDKLDAIEFSELSSATSADQPDGAVAARPTAPAAEPVPVHSGPRPPPRRRGLQPRCPAPCLDSAARVATRPDVSPAEPARPGQTPRSAYHWARATCAPRPRRRTAGTPWWDATPSLGALRARRLDRKGRSKQVPSGARGRAGVTRRPGFPPECGGGVGENATSCLKLILSIRSSYEDIGPPPLFPRLAPAGRYPATTPDVG